MKLESIQCINRQRWIKTQGRKSNRKETSDKRRKFRKLSVEPESDQSCTWSPMNALFSVKYRFDVKQNWHRKKNHSHKTRLKKKFTFSSTNRRLVHTLRDHLTKKKSSLVIVRMRDKCFPSVFKKYFCKWKPSVLFGNFRTVSPDRNKIKLWKPFSAL